MRILSVGNMYPPHHLGGYELVWMSAVTSLRSEGQLVRVLTSDYRAPNASVRDVEPDVFRELRWYWQDHDFPRLTVGERFRLELHNRACLQRHLADFRPHVVTWWAMGGMSLSLIGHAARAGVPAVAFVHDDWLVYGPLVDQWSRMFRRRRPLGWLVELLSGIPTRLDPADVADWLFVSRTACDAALRAGWILPTVSVAHSGIDPAFLVDAPAHEWRWRLLYVGRIDPRKGIDVAIDALALMPTDACLTIVGEGDDGEVQRLREQIERLNLEGRVELLGSRSRSELRDVYAGADAVIFPVRWSEPWGLVPLEAMAAGRPVVASGRGGSSEYLRDEVNCLLFDPDAPASLVRAIERLSIDQQLRETLREGGAETAREHTESRFNATVLKAVEAASSTANAPAGGQRSAVGA